MRRSEGKCVRQHVKQTLIWTQNIQWLIVGRAVAGIGAGGIVSLVWTITAEIVEADSQAKWSQALSVTWACSAIAGPILGGVFSGKRSAHEGKSYDHSHGTRGLWSTELAMGM